MNILLLLFYLFYVSFVFIVLPLLLCHVCYCDACKCLHGILGICVWFYPNKLVMMMMMMMTCSWSSDGNLNQIIDFSYHGPFVPFVPCVSLEFSGSAQQPGDGDLLRLVAAIAEYTVR